ncbi:MAG: hypothetical protein DRP42_01100 [Tenericutes bacterium]|nr:MAG: hypothetical protein DRP42_01100 [Mycoplasmatota bacterium]
MSLFAFLIFGFTFFYSHININPEETAENFQKSSTYIVGVKPGKDTENHIIKTVNSMAFMGAVFLTTLAILPNIFGMMGVPQSISLGGTGLIIMVSVSLETVEQLKARILASNKKQNEVKIDSKITTSEPTNKKVIENDDMSLFN